MIWEQINFTIAKSTRMSLEHFSECAVKFTLVKHCFLVFFFLFCFVFLIFRDRVSLYSPGCPGTHSVDQAGLELRNPPASASRVRAPPPTSYSFMPFNLLPVFLASQAPPQYTIYYLLSAVL
jgi:hypothetical protein